MIRVLVLVLLAANLLYFGWSRWISAEQTRLVTPDNTVAAADAQQEEIPPCVTIGPIVEDTLALELEQLLRDQQLALSRRTVTEQLHNGWWVYVAANDAATQARTLRNIQNSGIRDAFAMPDDRQFRVSVGLFREEAGARSRADVVRRLQLEAVVEERFDPQVATWFDLPGSTSEHVDLARLVAEGVNIDSLRVEDCPVGADVAIGTIVEDTPAGESASPGAAATP